MLNVLATTTETKKSTLTVGAIETQSLAEKPTTKKVVSTQNIIVPQQINVPTPTPLSEQVNQLVISTSSSSTVEFMTAAVTTCNQNGTSVVWYALPLLALIVGASVFLSGKKEPSVFEEYTIIDDGK